MLMLPTQFVDGVYETSEGPGVKLTVAGWVFLAVIVIGLFLYGSEKNR